jgi:hypothetical protein
MLARNLTLSDEERRELAGMLEGEPGTMVDP